MLRGPLYRSSTLYWPVSILEYIFVAINLPRPGRCSVIARKLNFDESQRAAGYGSSTPARQGAWSVPATIHTDDGRLQPVDGDGVPAPINDLYHQRFLCNL